MTAAAVDSKRRRQVLVAAATLLAGRVAHARSPQDSIERVKASVVAVGTYQATRVPQFQFRGTGFAVDDGTLVATNAHVLPDPAAAKGGGEQIAIALPMSAGPSTQVRIAKPVAVSPERDLALLRIPVPPLPALELQVTGQAREGDAMLLTGFPLGTILGTFPVTHRVMIAAIAPIAIPPPSARHLDAARIRALQAGAFPIFQLDGTVHPGNSGSPLYDPETGAVVGVVNMSFVRNLREGVLPQATGIAYAIPAPHLAELLRTIKP